MRFRKVLVLTRESERALRRLEAPHGFRFQMNLLTLVLKTLDQEDGSNRHLQHAALAVLAVLLRDMGVVVTGSA